MMDDGSPSQVEDYVKDEREKEVSCLRLSRRHTRGCGACGWPQGVHDHGRLDWLILKTRDCLQYLGTAWSC